MSKTGTKGQLDEDLNSIVFSLTIATTVSCSRPWNFYEFRDKKNIRRVALTYKNENGRAEHTLDVTGDDAFNNHVFNIYRKRGFHLDGFNRHASETTGIEPNVIGDENGFYERT